MSLLLSVSVDLDELRCYEALHGLAPEAPGCVYERAVPRLANWARQRGMPLTWFVVGRDLDDGGNARAITKLAAAGDEVACHSFSHFYDLVLRPRAEIREEVERGVSVIETVVGTRVRGFRAPGYTVNDTLLALLQELGLSYDSSIFPCPAYYTLKAAALLRMRVLKRVSKAILDTSDVLRAPAFPYRTGRPYWYSGSGIMEVPIQVTRRARLPFIGTALTLAGPTGARLLARGVVGETFVNLELHGIDALDESDGLTDLAKHQPDLRIPWQRKLDAIDAAIGVLRAKGYASVRMDELAARAARG